MSLTNTSFILRPWTAKDAESLAWHANNPKVSGMLRDIFPYPYTIEDAKRWITDILPIEYGLFYAIEINGKAVGGIGVNYKTDIYALNGEIGYWLGEAYWGGGIMTRALQKVIIEVFSTTAVNRIYAEVFDINKSSAKVLVKCGFSLEATLKNAIIKNEQIMDVHIYVKYKNSGIV
ncbi:MAG: GNAT family protein [Bacteroidales bacterium]|nr:GNAT family protein [Bacteroidales bacterium]